MNERFVLDVFDDGLVVIPIGEARRLAAVNDALERSTSWGEFLTSMSGDNETLAYLNEQYDEGLPGADEPFDAEELLGFADGDWPAWPKREMLQWLPASVLRLGTPRECMVTGSFLHFDEDREDELVEALAAEGIECRSDTEGLIGRACGEWKYA